MTAGKDVTKGSTGLFSKGLETSRGRADVLEDVELDPSIVPARTGDGARPDHGAEAETPGRSADGSQAAEPPRGRSETEPEGTGDSRDSPTPGRRADGHASEGRDDASSLGTESTQGDGASPTKSDDSAEHADSDPQNAEPTGHGPSKQWAPPGGSKVSQGRTDAVGNVDLTSDPTPGAQGTGTGAGRGDSNAAQT